MSYKKIQRYHQRFEATIRTAWYPGHLSHGQRATIFIKMFQDFAREWNFTHHISSSGYPQSNDKAENAVKIAKKIIKSAERAGSDTWLALLAYRNTPAESLRSSPSQNMFSRRTNTLLPTTPRLTDRMTLAKESKLMCITSRHMTSKSCKLR